jgi:hypothetical protein
MGNPLNSDLERDEETITIMASLLIGPLDAAVPQKSHLLQPNRSRRGRADKPGNISLVRRPMNIEGRFTVALPTADVWTAIIDPNVADPWIPGCKAMEVLGPDNYHAPVVVAFGPDHDDVQCRNRGQRDRGAGARGVRDARRGATRACLLTADNLLALPARRSRSPTAPRFRSSDPWAKFGLGIMKKGAKGTRGAFA